MFYIYFFRSLIGDVCVLEDMIVYFFIIEIRIVECRGGVYSFKEGKGVLVGGWGLVGGGCGEEEMGLELG